MATKGYLREIRNAEVLYHSLRRMRRAGCPLPEISIGGYISRMIDQMECGDELVALSVSELSPQIAR